MEFLGVRPAEVRLPVKARDPAKIVSRLEPSKAVLLGRPVYAWLKCRGLACVWCINPGRTYRVVYGEGEFYDVLSGLTARIAYPRALVDGMVVWEAEWRYSWYVVEDIECLIRIGADGSVECPGVGCTGPECLAECLSRHA